MDRFEYLVARATGDRVVWVGGRGEVAEKPPLHEFLNALGREGWELVAVTESKETDGGLSGLFGDSHYIQDLYLKRRVVA